MNKAITDGLELTPTPFSAGLGVWSSGDGTPGSDTYDGSGTGVFVSADQHFDGCLEVYKTASVQKVRYMGETIILPGCYLRVTAKVKAIAGPLPSVRIAGWAGGSGGVHITGQPETGPSTALDTYGQVVEVSAIIGTGYRTGVDMVWNGAIYGHFGIDITGTNGAVVRVDDIQIEDITSVFVRDMMGVVDVRDYGAKGDGVTDDSAAFEAADNDARGREVLVSEGVYYLADHVTIANQIRFEGKLVMPAEKRVIFQKNFDFATYADAFADEDTAFRKAFQALLNFTDHEALDLCGRRIGLKGPIDMQAAEGSRSDYSTRRVIRNGQFEPISGSAWNTDTVTAQATYSAGAHKTLTNVASVSSIQVGSLVEGAGVGREIYVTAVDIGAKEVSISQPLYDAEGTQVFTFKRFKYLLDFSGFESLSQFILDDIEFKCSGEASAIMLARSGLTFHVRDCFITRPKDRGITSIGNGCQGMMIDRCQFISNEMPLDVPQRTTIGFNVNANDAKIRDCRSIRFRHWGILCGAGNLITGNHWFQDDTVPDGVRMAGLVFTLPNCKTVINGNYIDNNYVEWTNEHDATPDLGVQYSFGGMTITGNIFTVNDVASWFNWIIIKPYGTGHFVHGFSVTDNVFLALNGNITRAEAVDTTFAGLDSSRFKNVTFAANTFNSVAQVTESPAVITHTQNSPDAAWIVDTVPYLPFGGRARTVEAVIANGKIRDANNNAVFEVPYSDAGYGATNQQVRLVWSKATKGKVNLKVRVDAPL